MTDRHRRTLDLGIAHALLDPDPDRRVLRILRRLCQLDGWCFAAVWKPDGNHLRCHSAWPASTTVAPFLTATLRARVGRGDGPLGRVWVSGQALSLSELEHDPRFVHASCGLQQGCIAPIIANAGVIGVLELYRHERWVTGDDAAELACEVGHLLGQADDREAERQALSSARARTRFGLCRLLSFETAQPGQGAEREHRIELLRDAVADLDAVPTHVPPEDSTPYS